MEVVARTYSQYPIFNWMAREDRSPTNNYSRFILKIFDIMVGRGNLEPGYCIDIGNMSPSLNGEEGSPTLSKSIHYWFYFFFSCYGEGSRTMRFFWLPSSISAPS
jgi:hypothetical protein